MTAASARELLLRPDYVVPHTDADGLAAGAIALRARGEGAAAAVLLTRVLAADDLPGSPFAGPWAGL